MRPEIQSLHYLRGLAALMVLYVHVAVVGTVNPDAAVAYFPTITGPVLPFAPVVRGIIAAPEIWLWQFDLYSASIGVSAFFLISGYVIMRSLDKTPPGPFLVGRLFRIMPLTIVATIACAAVLAIYSITKGMKSPVTMADVAYSVLLLPADRPPLPVLWTLAIEMWFYFLLAFAVSLKRGRFGLGSIVALAVLAASFSGALPFFRSLLPAIVSGNATVEMLTRYSSFNLTFVTFILAGSAIYRAHSEGRIWCGSIATLIIMLSVVVATKMFEAFYPGGLSFRLPNLVAGLALFLTFIALDRFIPRMSVARFFGDISFPLYLIHIPMSWLLMRWAWANGLPDWSAFAFAIIVSIAAAVVLHRTVEKPMHLYGRSFYAKRSSALA